VNFNCSSLFFAEIFSFNFNTLIQSKQQQQWVIWGDSGLRVQSAISKNYRGPAIVQVRLVFGRTGAFKFVGKLPTRRADESKSRKSAFLVRTSFIRAEAKPVLHGTANTWNVIMRIVWGEVIKYLI
jgi:hypothetical protein